mmetsp:Transcript_22632/g.27749  ORF Transcript_22632/g.27749 Transcript_22632/m.27749 type:complete len:689 (+) Transcript_22632:91-2157(+)
MHYTASLKRLASTRGGMRSILKRELPPVEFIKYAVQTGVYKSIYHPDNGSNNASSNRRGGNNKMRGGGRFQNDRHTPAIDKYPLEYEILSLNPPIPDPPRLSRKELRQQEAERTSLPTDKLVKSYMLRYDARMKASSPLTDAEREDYYYRKTLGVPNSNTSSPRAEDMNTAMGRKPTVLSHAYEFALKQYEVLSTNEGMTETESIQKVEEILAQEEKDEMLQSRMNARQVVQDLHGQTEDGKEAKTKVVSSTSVSLAASTTKNPPTATIPSILYSKPRTIQALYLWGKRLQAVPYNQWTLGATTALDHWIAVDVLGMKESTWQRLLSGELEHDTQESRNGQDLVLGDKARMKDIITVKCTLFPETVLHAMDDEEDGEEDVMSASPDDDLDLTSEKESTERSIDELLASLGGFEDDDEDDDESTSSDEDMDVDLDTRVSLMMDSLQEWRAKHEEKPFQQWDDAAKKEFNKWQSDYVSLVTSETDGEVDFNATREALLSEPPLTREASSSFWSKIEDEADAEILLHGLREKKEKMATTESLSPLQKKSKDALDVFLNISYEKQLRQLVSMGSLRPILDEYYKETDRIEFMNRYGETLLEGVEVEHLVVDADGPIALQDVGDDSLLKEGNIDKNTRFSIKMIPYGTDEFGMTRSEKARVLYRAWSMQKAGKARYAESQFKKGKMPLKVGKK